MNKFSSVYNKKTMDRKSVEISVLADMYNSLKEHMGIKSNTIRNKTHIAVRAAFIRFVNGLNAYSLVQIGAAVGKHHGTVINSLRKSEWGQYDTMPEYAMSFDFLSNYYTEKGLSVKLELPEHLETLETLKRKLVYASREIDKLNARVAKDTSRINILVDRIKTARTNVEIIRNAATEANAVLIPLERKRIPLNLIEEMDRSLKTFDVV